MSNSLSHSEHTHIHTHYGLKISRYTYLLVRHDDYYKYSVKEIIRLLLGYIRIIKLQGYFKTYPLNFTVQKLKLRYTVS